ncbi:DUF1499 domain-containing protein [uncultured Ilyobacter sp.]|uniref:DUF1499 domain-containing protein n=1 Tax=uncultured Ilyobacter sp. TaxID=544433 RepID=UPI0029C60793|nr:DUF1499 domain-containing protein [uncultured Ilyobacter sp.]
MKYVIGFILVFMTFGCISAPKNLGVKSGKMSPLKSSPNGVSSQTDQVKKQVDPLVLDIPVSDAKKIIKAACKNYGKHEIINESEDYLYAVFITGIMRYRDDVEFYFDAEDKVIHYRSQSRIGYSDMGLNRKRYNELAEFYYKNKQ